MRRTGSTGNATSASVPCSVLLNANIGQGQICSNKLTSIVPGGDVTQLPWMVGGVPVGVTFLPVGMSVSATTSVSAANVANPTYFGTPTFYISDMGASADQVNFPGEIYQVDAVGYGGANTTAAVVESTYVVYTSSSNTTI